ncbi:unnamed protein product, partial [marine sediment metagenome]
IRERLEEAKIAGQFLNLCPECRKRELTEKIKLPAASIR